MWEVLRGTGAAKLGDITPGWKTKILEIKLFSGQIRSSIVAKSTLNKGAEASRWPWWMGEAGEEQTGSCSCTCQQGWLQQTWKCTEINQKEIKGILSTESRMEKNSIVHRIKWKKAAEKITFLPPQVDKKYFTEIEKKAMVAKPSSNSESRRWFCTGNGRLWQNLVSVSLTYLLWE